MKVLIIGCGPAGLACAEHILAQSKFDVTVVERKRSVGENPRCAGGISRWMMEKAGVSIPQSSIVATLRSVRIHAPNMKYWELKGDEDYGYVLNRELFEQTMAERVEGLGGKLVLGHSASIKDLEFWQSQYDYIVGADGPVSVVRQWLGLFLFGSLDTHFGVQKTITMDYYPQDTIELYFGEKVAPEGYAWIFPAGDGLVRIGLGVPVWRGWRAINLLESFIQRQVRDYKEVRSVAKQIPTAKMPETGVYGKVVLVGDALPSTDPLTGGGICQGIASGKAAAQAIVEGSLANYDYYISWLRKQNNRRYRLKKVLYAFSDENLNELVDALHGFNPKSFSLGKELRRGVIYLLLRKPRLLRKFFRYLR